MPQPTTNMLGRRRVAPLLLASLLAGGALVSAPLRAATGQETAPRAAGAGTVRLYVPFNAGGEAGCGWWYRAGLAVAAIFFAYQQWLIRRREPADCFRAFNNNHYIGMVVFIGLALDYLYRGG